MKLSRVSCSAKAYAAGIIADACHPIDRLADAIRAGEDMLSVLSDADVNERTDFEAGGVCSKAASITLLVEYVHGFTHSAKGSYVFVNDCARRGDEVVETYHSIVYLGDNVLHYVASNASSSQIRNSIVQAETSISLIGFGGHTELQTDARGAVSGNEMARYVACVKSIIVGAFDGECYLVWEKGQQHQSVHC